MPEPSILDERLAEIDRRLRSIQSGLEPAPAAPSDDPDTRIGWSGSERLDDLDPDELAGRLDDDPPGRVAPSTGSAGPPPRLRVAPPTSVEDERRSPPRGPASFDLDPGQDAADRLAELTDAHERLLELHRELLSQYAEVLERRAGETAPLSLTAGPFETAAIVREFERSLRDLPGVGAVTVREYLGDDRVALDVRLSAG